MFEPTSLPGAPSGLHDLPRPFVFRAWHLDTQTFQTGEEFHFDLNLFDVDKPAIAYLAHAFAQFASQGLGPARSQVELTGVWQLSLTGKPQVRIFEGETLAAVLPEPLALSLSAPLECVSSLRARFVTPTELKTGGTLANTPDFEVLASRLRDRISTLAQHYGKGPLDIDFRSFGDRAKLIRTSNCRIEHVAVERKSSRTRQVHSIGGFIGEATYEGPLSEFIPYLRAAAWTGVGRQTVWGKGELQITPE